MIVIFVFLASLQYRKSTTKLHAMPIGRTETQCDATHSKGVLVRAATGSELMKLSGFEIPG